MLKRGTGQGQGQFQGGFVTHAELQAELQALRALVMRLDPSVLTTTRVPAARPLSLPLGLAGAGAGDDKFLCGENPLLHHQSTGQPSGQGGGFKPSASSRSSASASAAIPPHPQALAHIHISRGSYEQRPQHRRVVHEAESRPSNFSRPDATLGSHRL